MQQLRRSQLFVPGNDERKILKALGLAHCDSIIFDLEDAVPPSEKGNARQLLKRLLGETRMNGAKELCVRINSSSTPFAKDDIAEFRDFGKLSTFVVPKADHQFIKELSLIGKKLIPLIETPRGFLEMEDIARSNGVVALGFGAADFANSVGGRVETYMKNIHVKTQLAIVSRAYGVDPIDNVFFGVSDLSGFREEARQSKELGFAGKQVIHPTQIEIANEMFSPSQEEIEHSRVVVEAYERAQSNKIGAIKIDEHLVDAVHYRQAKEILEKSKLIQESS